MLSRRGASNGCALSGRNHDMPWDDERGPDDAYEPTYPDGSVKHECWRGFAAKGARPAQRASSGPPKAPADACGQEMKTK